MSDPDNAEDPLIGRRFGSYVVEKKLGEGGMGAVYRAVQPEIGKQVAIKFLASHLASNPDVVKRFFDEARAVNLIQHDNIVDIFDFGQIDGFSFFVMELMKGGSLESLLEQMGKLSVGRAVDIAIQIADAIGAAHARNIIHRDLKPDNAFLVTRSGRQDFVKLLDFGIAKLTDTTGSSGVGRTMAGMVLGTPGYMSPEQGTGGTVDFRTDIYALGAILFRMLSGRLPFEGRTFPEILQKQLIEPPPNLKVLRPELSPTLVALVHQMIARDANERPPSMGDVVARLHAEMPHDFGRPVTGPFMVARAATGSQPILAASPTTLSGATGERSVVGDTFGEVPQRKSPALLIGGGVALVAAVVGVVLFGMKKPPAPAPAPVAAAPAPAPAPTTVAPTPTPPVPTPAAHEFQVFVDTDPQGAEIWNGNLLLGKSPVRVTIKGDSGSLRLHLAGFKDERLDVTPDTEHAVVGMHGKVAAPSRTPPPSKMIHQPPPPPTTRLPTLPSTMTGRPVPPPASVTKKPAIGLDD
jgi:serine/threonine-protein kinase